MIAPIPASPASSAVPDSKAAQTAKSFEAVFLGQMTQMMMATVETDGAFSGGHGEEMFRGVLAEKLGTAIAAAGGVGLAPAVLRQIIALQEGSAA
ncbi:rod-binding protein [Sphingomonas sp. CFBP9019]|uniref:rod-binding protein n=1 Tax=Sphingomonas sp. CFBP9019 TaxID=3096532 RepID=UPI002A6A67FD|nr:rod-binding protein [Sphingomonas sp. CFBP9019]MDY1009925.1 rod-binding protein [Sphingomonas sp. CFBP9019]